MTQFISARNITIFKMILAALLLFSLAVGTSKLVKASGTISISSHYLTISVNPGGPYTITANTPAWTFGGNIGQPLTNVTINTGSDSIGSYQEIDFTYQDSTGASRGGGLRTYNHKPVVLFIDSYLSQTSNSSPFPHLTTYPHGLYTFSYVGAYAHPYFTKMGADGPWVFFDGQKNTFLLSPASNFMIASTTEARDGSISSGITTTISTLPQGFTHKTFLVIGQGINHVFETWGNALTALGGKKIPQSGSDRILSTLGYWTDSQLPYSYNYDPNLGYAGTLLAVKKSFSQRGIPLGYMQLDSWWYPKGPQDTWRRHGEGIYTYTADPTLFPNGLLAFQQQLGIPLLLHSKFIDPSSPYRSEYTMSNNVSTDPRYWNAAASYLKANGGIGFEEDWLNDLALPAINLSDPDAYMNNMANAMAANGISVQYCMQLPGAFLQSSLYNNVTHVRVSGDRFDSTRWDHLLYTSRLARSVGTWPWSDAFFSTETDNLLLSTLSAGPVGVGDAIDTESAKNLLQTIRTDGVIVKPDESILPIDDMYLQDAQGLTNPMVASTYTDFKRGMKELYVFTYARGSNTMATFSPAALGLSGKTYVYNYFTGRGTLVPAGGSFSATVTSGSYYIVVPIGPSGIGFLGDAGKFVSLGKKRITQLSDNGSVQATISFAKSETAVTIHGYSPQSPVVIASNGSVGSVSYDSSTHIFSVPVSPGANYSATITIN